MEGCYFGRNQYIAKFIGFLKLGYLNTRENAIEGSHYQTCGSGFLLEQTMHIGNV